ncbi:MAG TPA: hypothetical protein VHA33_03175 [Candidatus Angelobacter sp.]|jgi:hypothetical protein|nr:hypothetical protein [Candidatus Angelobacter sp.]
MSRVGRVIKSYLLWTHDRGSFHYDVMVTVILLFVFVGPRFIDFKDQPAEHLPHPTAVEITPDGNNSFVCLVDVSALGIRNTGSISPNELRSDLLRLIQPIAGDVTIVNAAPVRDRVGHIVAYRVQFHK